MKTKIAIATLFTSCGFHNAGPCRHGPVVGAVSDGQAGGTANLNLSGAGNPAGSSGYIVASGYDNLFPSTTVAPPKFSGASTANLDVTTDKGGVNKGLGLNSNDAPYVGPTDAIVLDLSNVKATLGGAKINQVTFDLYKDITGGSTWVVYGTTLAGGKGTATLIASGKMLLPGRWLSAPARFTPPTSLASLATAPSISRTSRSIMRLPNQARSQWPAWARCSC